MIPDNVSENCINLVKKFEGLHKVGADGLVSSYRCPAGKWTIGYGHTKGVRSGQKITAEKAEEFLFEDLQEHAQAVHRYVNVPLSQHQFDALVSFVFNLGAENFRKSTLLKKLNQGLYDEVPEQLMRWNKARVDGKLTSLRGLTRRRAAEGALFTMDAKLSADGGDKMPQKVSQEDPKPLTHSRTMAGASIAGAGTMLSGVSEQLQDLVPYSDMVKYVFLAVALGGIALAAYARWNDHKEGIR